MRGSSLLICLLCLALAAASVFPVLLKQQYVWRLLHNYPSVVASAHDS